MVDNGFASSDVFPGESGHSAHHLMLTRLRSLQEPLVELSPDEIVDEFLLWLISLHGLILEDDIVVPSLLDLEA